jgi:hypothetical protein
LGYPWLSLFDTLRAVRLVRIRSLIDRDFTGTAAWQRIDAEVRQAISAVVWPPGSTKFTICPEKKGNGVKPIREGFVAKLSEFGWKSEQMFSQSPDDEITTKLPGKIDVMLYLDDYGLRPFAVEWETGNISSSHRAMNKMALALKQGRISGGLLVLPNRTLYPYLTERIGNYQELEPYLSLYTDLEVDHGYFGVAVVEHDAVDPGVEKIAKGTDGWALVQRPDR